ncbi:MAG TPA: carboxylating nicotinate-nucleotide diphosphorylase [Dinghuibacter sp.]|jgi:nicotinate-nucleotide pyrophosphorylase (carboxylating)|uniref:carboxylating nicotinate-nucleotide diphosphorylase n=1 Tax=Dinghuibacter sp. TaxID=2024697 RepID=UPI002BCE3316|nr:carboxylating nicotinate-nucleotide diphosphorylase [Dinghuibacter sp.]HTJ10906.1 carboxylating nicotinate-nucleotide diphosphorylase [Dinghuibacter sp.]
MQHKEIDPLDLLIDRALQEDIGPGDYSTVGCIPAHAVGRASLKVKDRGILAGMDVAERIFRRLQPDCRITAFLQDGAQISPGDIAFDMEARVHTILLGERLVLNCMQRMSGIATLTHTYTRLLEGYHTRLLDTRKTTPNFRILEKEAVRIGGGLNHRMGLYDMIMLKDNHIDYCGGLEKAVDKAWHYSREHRLGLKIEVETRNLEDVAAALRTGKVDRILLDNFAPEMVAEALNMISGRVETEASGGINLDNIILYAATGVDFVSVGAVIHQARSLDLSLKAIV